jgi:hypothetical protein
MFSDEVEIWGWKKRPLFIVGAFENGISLISNIG